MPPFSISRRPRVDVVETSDGNGRVSRLLTNYLLDRDGYDVGKFVSLEKRIKDSEGRYYATLGASTTGWDENEHDVWPWLGYFAETVAGAYEAFMARTEEERGRGQKIPRCFVLHQGLRGRLYVLARVLPDFDHLP